MSLTASRLARVFCGFFAAACFGCAANEATPPPVPLGAPGAELVARRGTLKSSLLLTGELKAIEASPILVPRTPTSQMPIRWMEDDGALVQEGQRVMELDNTEFTGNLAEKRLAESRALNETMQKEAEVSGKLAELRYKVEESRIQVNKAKIDADVPAELRSRREYQEKELVLYKAELALANAEETLRATEESSRAELEEVRIALDKARFEVRTAEEAIKALILVAPRDGILVVEENPMENRKFQVGDTTWVGFTVMSIPELTAMKVLGRLSDVDDGKIAPGMRVLCTLDTYPDDVYEGRVMDITPIAKEQGRDSMRRAFRVNIHLDRSDPERMRPGMSVRAQVLVTPREDQLLAPRVALDLESEPPRARLANGSMVEVQLGPCNAQVCVITDGLAEGDRLRRVG